MTIQQLPKDLQQGGETKKLMVYDYHIQNPCIKNKIQLTTNVFSFLLEGTKELITHNTTTTIDNRQFLAIQSGNCLMSEKLSPSNNYRSLLLFFSDDMVLNFVEKHKISLQSLKNTPTAVPYHVCQYDTFVYHFVKGLQTLQQYPKDLQAQILPLKWEEIMTYLLHKKGTTFLQSFLKTQDDQKRHFTKVVENNALNHLTIQELAFLCNMSVSTFKREFERQYQTSPIRWFQHQRLEHSAFVLSTKQKRPIDLYEETGFESLSSFTQAFKQKYGITPKQYQIAS